jgi:CheY-specific phosphatase CheX
MKPEHWRRIHDELALSCIKLFQDNNVELTQSSSDDTNDVIDDAVVSFIGFMGEHLRGSLMVIAPMALILRSHPLRSRGAVQEAAAQDWAGELANQILGNLQGRLGPLGVILMLSTPTSARGDRVRAREERSEAFRRLQFVAEPDRLVVLFDAIALDGATLTLDEANAAEKQVDMEMLLF